MTRSQSSPGGHSCRFVSPATSCSARRQRSCCTSAAPITYSFWFREDSADPVADYTLSFILGYGGYASTGFQLYPNWVQASWLTNDGTAVHGGSGSLVTSLGVVYHCVLVVDNGSQTFYVNNVVVARDTQPGPEGYPNDPKSYPLTIQCAPGQSVTIDDVAIAIGYAATASDVNALFRRTSTPTQVFGSHLAWYLTLAGPAGATAAVGDAGLTDQSSNALSVISISKGYPYGTPATEPVYQAAPLDLHLAVDGERSPARPLGRGHRPAVRRPARHDR